MEITRSLKIKVSVSGEEIGQMLKTIAVQKGIITEAEAKTVEVVVRLADGDSYDPSGVEIYLEHQGEREENLPVFTGGRQ